MTKRYRKISNSLIQKIFCEECIIASMGTGNVPQSNPVAACIWPILVENEATGWLAATLVDELGVDSATAVRDVETFAAELVNLGLTRRSS